MQKAFSKHILLYSLIVIVRQEYLNLVTPSSGDSHLFQRIHILLYFSILHKIIRKDPLKLD